MTVDSFIADMRERQADLFSSTVAMARVTGEGAFDEATASYGPPTEASVYAGPGLVRPTVVTVADTGRTSIVVDSFEVKVPADTPVEIGDNIDVTGSTFDAALVGLQLRVTEVTADEWQICRKVTAVRQTERPE